MPDIDIDFADRNKAIDLFNPVSAAMKDASNTLIKHKTGIYCTSIPHNPLTKLSTIDYKEAENRGYFKIDLLNVSVYNKIKTRDHLLNLMNKSPMWDLLLEEDFVNTLFHLNGHTELVKRVKPSSIEQLAAVLAMIRPAKRHLVDKDWDSIMQEIWIKPDNDEYYFKKAHAIAYAHVIVVQMNLICEEAAKTC